MMEDNHNLFVGEKNKKETMISSTRILSVDENVDHSSIASKSVLPVIVGENPIVKEHDASMKKSHVIVDHDQMEFNNNEDNNNKIKEHITIENKQM